MQHRRKNPGPRRERALQRRAARAKRTDVQQIAHLEAAGHGHCKEAQRLRRKVA